MIRMVMGKLHLLTCWMFCVIWPELSYLRNKERLAFFFCIRVRCLRDWKFHFLSLSFLIRIISIVQTLNKKITNQSLLWSNWIIFETWCITHGLKWIYALVWCSKFWPTFLMKQAIQRTLWWFYQILSRYCDIFI